MKRKYYGLLSIALILLTLAATALYAIRISHSMAKEMYTSRIKPFNSISIPDIATIKEIEVLEEKIMGLARPKRSDLSPVNLVLFGYQPMKKPKVTKKERTIILHVLAQFLILCHHLGEKILQYKRHRQLHKIALQEKRKRD